MCESPEVPFKRMKFEPKFYHQPVAKRPERIKQKKFRTELGEGTSYQAQVPQSPQSSVSLSETALIFDSGGHTIKMGSATDEEPTLIPNAIMKVKSEKKRLFIGNQIEECRDLSGLYFLLPCERGYITKWEVQKPIWDYAFNKGVSIEDRCVVMTQPLFNFKSIQDGIDELFFEDYEVKAIYRANPTDFSRYQYCTNILQADEPCLVIDSGFSFTHIVPYIDGKKYFKGIKRVNVGGKFLTNYLRDIISYRLYDVMEETYVINQVKEDCVFVSMDVKAELKKTKSPTEREAINISYVLPDFNMVRRGYIRKSENDEIAENCQILHLNNERFTVPELLFHPKDIGMTSVGVAEAVANCILDCPEAARESLARNLVLTGGNVRIAGFEQRLLADVQSFMPDKYHVRSYKPENPVTFAWTGGKSLSNDPSFKNLMVTKQDYEEHGSKITYERFNAWSSAPDDSPPKPTEHVPFSYLEHIKRCLEEDEAQEALEQLPTFVEDPGEGPSTRCDVTAPVASRPEEDEKTSTCSATGSDDETTRSSETASKTVNRSPNKKKRDGDGEEITVEDMIREAEREAMMECVKTYI